MNTDRPIGVFDSGIGGLTVVKALIERLPRESILYFGDTARVPYGVKSRRTIELFTEQIVDFLLEKEVKALVIACNTISAVALGIVKEKAAGLPLIDVISSGAKEALNSQITGPIGVIATSTTVNSNAYANAIAQKNPHVRVISEACSLLVPLVEEGWLNNDMTRLAIQHYLKPLLTEKIDTLILGCTHYPLLKPLIAEEVGDKVRLIDSALATAKHLAHKLEKAQLLRHSTTPPRYHYYVSDLPLRFRTIGERFLGRSLDDIHRHLLD